MPPSPRHYRILNPDESYTFATYFELPFSPKDILLDLECTLVRATLDLPRLPLALERIDALRTQN